VILRLMIRQFMIRRFMILFRAAIR